MTVNDVIMHASVSGAPFGGVGGSGHGYYHGVYGFNNFTHMRTVMNSPGWLERVLAFRYPPFNASKTPKSLVLKANFKRDESIDDQHQTRPLFSIRAVSTAAAVSFLGVWYFYLRNSPSR